MVGQGGDGKASNQGQGVEGGDKDLAESLIPLVVRVLPAQLDHGVHGDGDDHVKDVRAGQGADEELQGLPFLLLGADAQYPPGVGQDGDA